MIPLILAKSTPFYSENLCSVSQKRCHFNENLNNENFARFGIFLFRIETKALTLYQELTLFTCLGDQSSGGRKCQIKRKNQNERVNGKRVTFKMHMLDVAF